MNRFVYFLRPIGKEGPIKIGCSYEPKDRLSGYMAWSPVPLEIVATIPGNYTVESRFHAKFEHLHSHFEWFNVGPDLTETIEAIRAGTFDVDALPGVEGSIRSNRAKMVHARRKAA